MDIENLERRLEESKEKNIDRAKTISSLKQKIKELEQEIKGYERQLKDKKSIKSVE